MFDRVPSAPGFSAELASLKPALRASAEKWLSPAFAHLADEVLSKAAQVFTTRAPPADAAHRVAWTRRVVGNIARETRRAEERRLAREAVSQGMGEGVLYATAWCSPGRREAAVALRYGALGLALASLEPLERDALFALTCDGLTEAEAARDLGVSRDVLRLRHARALEKLRRAARR